MTPEQRARRQAILNRSKRGEAMEADESGVTLPRKCQLTLVFENGTTIQVMVNDTAIATLNKIEQGMANGGFVEIEAINKDERVHRDTMRLRTEKLIVYSTIQAKPESRIHAIASRIQPV